MLSGDAIRCHMYLDCKKHASLSATNSKLSSIQDDKQIANAQDLGSSLPSCIPSEILASWSNIQMAGWYRTDCRQE